MKLRMQLDEHSDVELIQYLDSLSNKPRSSMVIYMLKLAMQDMDVISSQGFGDKPEEIRPVTVRASETAYPFISEAWMGTPRGVRYEVFTQLLREGFSLFKADDFKVRRSVFMSLSQEASTSSPDSVWKEQLPKDSTDATESLSIKDGDNPVAPLPNGDIEPPEAPHEHDYEHWGTSNPEEEVDGDYDSEGGMAGVLGSLGE